MTSTSIEIYSEIIKSHLKNLILKYNLSEFYEEHTNTSIINKKHTKTTKNTDFNINILSILDKQPFLLGTSLSESVILLEKSTELWMCIIIKSFYSQDRDFDHVFQLVDLVSACKFIRISLIFELILVLFSQLDEEDLLEIELFVFNSRLKRVFDYNKTRLYGLLYENHRGFKHGFHLNHASLVSTRVSFENLNKEKGFVLSEDVSKTRIFNRILNNSDSVQTIKSVKTKENHEKDVKIYNKKIINKENHENQGKNIRIHRNIELKNKENIMNMSNISKMTFTNTNTYTNTYISTEKTEKSQKTHENQVKNNKNQSFFLDFESESINDNNSLLLLLNNSSLKEHLQVIDKDYKNNHVFCIVKCISLSSELKAGSKLVVIPLKEVFTVKEKGLSKKCLDEIKEVYYDVGYIPYWMVEEFLSFFEKGGGVERDEI